MSWPWISARRLTSWHIKGCYPSCRRTEFEASCILEWLVFLQITNNVLSSVVNHHNWFQCHQVCHKVQCWAHCCSWYTSTTSQKISHPISDYLLMTVCCTAPLNHCRTANFSNRMLIDFYNGRKNGWWNSTSRSVPTWVSTNCSQDFKTSHIKWITMHWYGLMRKISGSYAHIWSQMEHSHLQHNSKPITWTCQKKSSCRIPSICQSCEITPWIRIAMFRLSGKQPVCNNLLKISHNGRCKL